MSGESPSVWTGLILPDEQLLWQGRPDASLVRFESGWGTVLFGVFLTVLSLGCAALMWWASAQAQDHYSGKLFALAWVPFGMIGLFTLIGSDYWKSFLRVGTHYALTTRRALILVRRFGATIFNAWPITAEMKLEITEGRPASVWFDEVVHRGEDTDWIEKIGFERIRDADEVFAQMQRIRALAPDAISGESK